MFSAQNCSDKQNNMNITFDRLRYFLEVAKLEHVGLASKSLGISPSAISSAIAVLEEEYQCPLFERSNKRIFLNEKGKILRERIEPIIEQVHDLGREINQRQVEFKGYLSLGGSYFLAANYLQPVINGIQKLNPGLRTENSPLRTAQVIQEVIDGIIDYGLCFSPNTHPQLERKLLHTGNLNIVIAKSHPLVKLIKKNQFKLDMLNDYQTAVLKSSPGVDFCDNHPMFEEHGILPKVYQYFHSDELCVQSVLESDIWTMVPDVVAEKHHSQLVIVPVPKKWVAHYEICSIYRKTMKNREVFTHLDECLKEQF